MKKKDLEQLKSRSVSELAEDLKNNKDHLWQLRMDLNSGKIKNVREVKKIKKIIAVINTLSNA